MSVPEFPAQFHIAARRGAPDAVTLALVGELDLDAARSLAMRLERMVDHHADIVLNLSELTFIDAAGLSALLRTLRVMRASGRSVAVGRQLSDQVRLLFEVVDAGPLIWPTAGER